LARAKSEFEINARCLRRALIRPAHVGTSMPCLAHPSARCRLLALNGQTARARVCRLLD